MPNRREVFSCDFSSGPRHGFEYSTIKLFLLRIRALWALAWSRVTPPKCVNREDGRLLYTLGALPFRLLQRLRVPSSPPVIRDFYSPDQPFRGSEVRAALNGAYGSITRIGGQGVLLYSAIPIRSQGTVVGVALVSQSTYEIQRDLERVRLATFKVFLVSIAVAGLLSLILSATIALPLRRLRSEAGPASRSIRSVDWRFQAFVSQRRDW